jgi:hypothetical protein
MILTTLQITLQSVAMRLARISSLLVALPAVSLLATTITTATGTNTNFAAAQLISEPDLIVNQSAPNYSLETAQQVSPQYYAADA